MEKDIRQIAQQLKMDLAQNAESSKRNVIEFANSYAFKKELRYQAILLNTDFTKADQTERKRILSERMQILIDAIVEDYQANAHNEVARKTKEGLETLENRFRLQIPPNQVVCGVSGLGKTFRKNGFKLEGIDLELRQGEITGVIGENGNGKTTLFRVIVGEILHDKGDLTFPLLRQDDPQDLNWFQIKTQIAYVPQDPPPWVGSLRSNLYYEAAIHGITGEDNLREVEFIIQRLGLEDHLDKKWGELSGGYKLRFSLARALVWKPKLLVIDEPLANLDIKAQQVILKDLRDLSRSFRFPVSVLISSQHLHEIEAVSDNILFLKEGQSFYYGKTADIGSTRTFNIFELDSPVDLKMLRNLLKELPILDLYYDGIHYIIKTSLSVDQKDVLTPLTAAGVEITYFRDIIRSTRHFFDLK